MWRVFFGSTRDGKAGKAEALGGGLALQARRDGAFVLASALPRPDLDPTTLYRLAERGSETKKEGGMLCGVKSGIAKAFENSFTKEAKRKNRMKESLLSSDSEQQARCTDQALFSPLPPRLVSTKGNRMVRPKPHVFKLETPPRNHGPCGKGSERHLRGT